MVTIKDLARIANVSPTTVSNVLHGHTNKVSKKTQREVQKAIAETQYVPNMGGRLLARHGSRIIGVIMTYARRTEMMATRSPFYSEIIGSLESAIRGNGYFMMLYTSGGVAESLGLAKTWDVEGLIVLGSTPEDAEEFFNEVTVPVVFIDTYGENVPNVGIDDQGAMRGLVNRLIAFGHQRIAFLTDSSILVGVDLARYQGYRDALEHHGIEAREEDLIRISFRDSVRSAELDDLVAEHFRGYTVLCYSSDLYATDAMSHLIRQGVSIPGDVSVTGFDGNILAQISTPQLMTVAQKVEDKGRVSVETLMDQIHEGEKHLTRIELPTQLIEGKSVAKLR
ncbi:MAG: LacI family DNA-binding transcriptional regulator [Bifidobacterium psychraerophilum]|jgi:LacI family transcriptional regulator|uniref:LacI family DNA-binding transcriptional regulator n=1 Tax=Bifidobacterium psychraerophilum TaxID=218140 RepID=UPI0039E8FDD4